MDPFTELNRLISQTKTTGKPASVVGTTHYYQELRAALSTERKYNARYYGVVLSKELLPPHLQMQAATGGVMKYRISIKVKEDAEKVTGARAAQLRERGFDIDNQAPPIERTYISREDEEAAQRAQENEHRYDSWCAEHPGATYEEKCAADPAFGPYALVDQYKENMEKRKEFDYFEIKRKAEEAAARFSASPEESLPSHDSSS